MTPRFLLKFVLAAVVLGGASRPARAQWFYPGGYGGNGWGGWGADPASGRMAGLGAYARGAGVYTLDQAKANAIERKSLIAWNKALQARKRALRAEKEKQEAKDRAEARVRNTRLAVEDGSTLNELLEQVLDFNAGKAEAYLTEVPLSSRMIRDIPFQGATEPITFCISQLVMEDAVPAVFRDERYAPEMKAVREAARDALAEDAADAVKPETRKALSDAVAALRKKFAETNLDDQVRAENYLSTIASLNVLLQDDSLKQALGLLETYEKGSVGDLVAFMEAFNLRFGPATSDQQKEIYRSLVPLLTAVRDRVSKDEQLAAADGDGKALVEAAKDAFKGMTWDQLDAQAKGGK